MNVFVKRIFNLFSFSPGLTSKTMTRATQMLNAIVCTSILFSFLSSFNIITHLTSLNIEHQCHDKKCKFKITKSNMFFQPGIIIMIYIFFFFAILLFPSASASPPMLCLSISKDCLRCFWEKRLRSFCSQNSVYEYFPHLEYNLE